MNIYHTLSFIGLTVSSELYALIYTSTFLEPVMLEPKPLSCVSVRIRTLSDLVLQILA